MASYSWLGFFPSLYLILDILWGKQDLVIGNHIMMNRESHFMKRDSHDELGLGVLVSVCAHLCTCICIGGMAWGCASPCVHGCVCSVNHVCVHSLWIALLVCMYPVYPIYPSLYLCVYILVRVYTSIYTYIHCIYNPVYTCIHTQVEGA